MIVLVLRATLSRLNYKEYSVASMQHSAHKNLERMVKGAAIASRQDRKKASKSTSRSRYLSSEQYQKLSKQIQTSGKTVQAVPLEMIDMSENIRSSYDDEKLESLAHSLTHDGLIHFPTVCMKKVASGRYRFHCRNGHRRILAARTLGWKNIDCVVISFETAQEELYHTINGNLSEDVFYLDLARAYDGAAQLGESDQQIADRVGVNVRTVGWYRRLVRMNRNCQELCRRHSDIFTATWAIKLARKGPLPPASVLEKIMKAMLHGESIRHIEEKVSPEQVKQRKDATRSIQSMLKKGRVDNQAMFTENLLTNLSQAGYISSRTLKKIHRDFFSS